MPKRARSTSTSQQRREEEEGRSRKEIRSKSRNERVMVNERISQLFYSGDSAKLYGQVFSNREVVPYKYVNMVELAKMFSKDNIDTAQYLVNQEWVDFVTVNRPICEYLLRVLMANLECDTMISWIGRRKVDLSEETWCRVFGLPSITSQDEEPIMSVAKEDIFFRLTGIRNLGVQQFVKINQLHQEAAMRMSAQIVMTILVPKKGSREQLRIDEARLLYAMVANQRINLVKMIISRLRSALGRKSTHISYGMHLMELMEKAGVDLRCTGEKEEIISATIDHHTLKRLGYKQQYGGWDYVGRRYATTSTQQEGQGEHGEGEQEVGQEEGTQEHTQAESSAPSRPRPTHIPANLRFHSQNLATKTDIAHLQNFLVEQLHLMQATLLSKLDSLDTKVQNCETHLRIHSSPPSSPIPHPTSDPKGKGPMTYPSPSPQPTAASPSSPIPPSHQSPPHHSPHPTHALSPQPILIPSQTSSSSTSSSSSIPSPSQYSIVPHTTTSQVSNDSEATQSNPPSKTPSPTHPISTPATPPPPTQSTPQPPPPPQRASPPVTAAYQRRRFAVSKLYPPYIPRLMPPPDS